MIVRGKRGATFTVVNNHLINDSKLDWSDLGLLTYLLSKPDNWQVSASHLAKQRKAGRDAVYAMLKRIREAGYATYRRNSDGSTDWIILDHPHPGNPDEALSGADPHPEKPDREKPDLENPTQVKTDCVVSTDCQQYSGPNGPGADAPPDDLFGGKPDPKEGGLSKDARARMWKLGVEILTNQGMSDSAARSFLGKQAKKGEAKLAGLIGEIAVKTPVDARSYIAGAMQATYNLYDESELQAAGRAYNVEPKVGESWDSFRGRVQEAMKGKAAA